MTKPTLTQSDTQPVVAHWALGDYYLVTLSVLLVGYAIFGKPFAYISIPPLYIGDLVFVLGIVVFLRSGSAVATFTTLPSLLLGTLCGWVIIRTLPYLGEFGIDALRDSVIVLYGGFAFIVAALLLEEPKRLPLIISFLRMLGSIVILATPFIFLVRIITDLAWIKPGLLANNLTGAALLMLLGFRRAGVGWCILLFIGMVLVSTQGRGAMLAIIIPLAFAFAMIATGRLRKLAVIVVTAAGLIGLAYMLDLSVPTVTPREIGETPREISATQLVENFSSIFGGPDVSSHLIGTINWRTEWWETILNYTFEGPFFWTGKGFGINLATADGFLVGDLSAPLLRSPHSAHFTILARAGIPGLALWLLAIGVWSAVLLVNMVRARTCGHNAWADLFVLVFCYGLSFIIDGTFDVSLEGPMAGIWFWSLFGVGIGGTMIYRASLGDIELNRRAAGTAQSKRINQLTYTQKLQNKSV